MFRHVNLPFLTYPLAHSILSLRLSMEIFSVIVRLNHNIHLSVNYLIYKQKFQIYVT